MILTFAADALAEADHYIYPETMTFPKSTIPLYVVILVPVDLSFFPVPMR